MQVNERNDIIVSPDENINQQIQELIRTMQEAWLENITLLFKYVESHLLMNEIISQLENLNSSWKSEEVKNTICELNGIYWQKHQEKGKKKLTKLVFPVEHYAAIYKDQLQNNRNAIAKWKMHPTDN